MRLAENAEKIDESPRAVDRVKWHIIREAVDREVVHPDWGVCLYKLHRIGRIDNDQREAGDRYFRLILDYRKLWRDRAGFSVYRKSDVSEEWTPQTRHNPDTRAAIADVECGMAHVLADDLAPESELEVARAKRTSKRYKEARAVAGPINSALEELLTEEIWPVSERHHKEIANALTRLFHFFTTGTNRE